MAKNSFLGHAPFLTLDSSDPASMAIHRNNKPAHFVNTLASELRLEGNAWMCALMECRIPKTFRTIPNTSLLCILVKPKLVNEEYGDKFLTREGWKANANPDIAEFNQLDIKEYPSFNTGFLPYYIPAGVYSTPRQISKQMETDINAMLQGSNMKIVSYERPDQTIAWQVFGGVMGVWSKNIATLSDYFGWKYDYIGTAVQGQEKRFGGVVDIDAVITDPVHMKPLESYSNVDVFCDAIATYSMGSQQVDHIATIPMNGVEEGETVVYTPSPHIYYPVSGNNMREIEVKVCRRNGELVNFMGGHSDRVSLKLHFKQQFLP
jgi:hypothetical protein